VTQSHTNCRTVSTKIKPTETQSHPLTMANRMGFSHTRVWLNYKSRGVTHVTYREYHEIGLGLY